MWCWKQCDFLAVALIRSSNNIIGGETNDCSHARTRRIAISHRQIQLQRLIDAGTTEAMYRGHRCDSKESSRCHRWSHSRTDRDALPRWRMDDTPGPPPRAGESHERLLAIQV